jgi:hypothetical protein
MLNIGKKLNKLKKSKHLTEAKADTQRLIDFAGEDLANRFLAIKSTLKAPENDLYYWIKNKTTDEFAQFISDVENTRADKKREIDKAEAGAKLVKETAHWKIYHITNFEASQKYGRDSTWCITGVNSYGDRYWKQYTEHGISFYFLITKGKYDPRGYDSKFALAIYPNNMAEAYNQQDDRVSFYNIPYYDEIEIPGLDIDELDWEDDYEEDYYYCEVCDCELGEDDVAWGPDGYGVYCDDCWAERFFVCDDCGEAYDLDDVNTNVFGEALCSDCYDSFLGSSRGAAQAFYYWSEDGIESFVGKITTENKKEIEKELHELATSWFKAKYNKQLDFTEAEMEDIENAFFTDAAEIGSSIKKEYYTKYDYRYLDEPTDTGYVIEVDGSSKKAENHSINVDEALEEILTFINGLSEEEKPKVGLSWRCASYGYNPDNEDFMHGYEGELIVSIYSDEEQKYGYFENEEEKIQEKTCANYYYAEDKIRAALGLPKRVYESLNESFYKSFREYETLWD